MATTARRMLLVTWCAFQQLLGPAHGFMLQPMHCHPATKIHSPFRMLSAEGPPVPEEDNELQAADRPTVDESKVEALKRIFVGTDFGYQVAGLTAAFIAFLVLSTTFLNDDFWTTPF